jgi:lycopene cyclase domain-containing protein
MKEYTIVAMVSLFLVIMLDRLVRTRLTSRLEFWVFIGVMFGFKLIFNGYLTWRPIVLYGERFFLNIRLGTIPLEDFLFGFSMITLTLVLWEFARKRYLGRR